MGKAGLTKNEMLSLEKATLHLRNLERLLVATLEKNLIAALKEETKALKTLSEEMADTSRRLFRLTNLLREIVKITGKIIDILVLVK